MKKSLRLILVFLMFLLVTIFLVACGKKKIKDPEEVLDVIKSIKSYESNVTYIIKNDKEEIRQNCKHYYDYKEGFRLDIEENRVQLYKKDKIFVKDLKNNTQYTLDKDFDELYRYSFINELMNLMYCNEEIKYFCKKIEGKSYMVVELIVPGSNRNIRKASMYIDEKTGLPGKIIIYDEKGDERVEVIYEKIQVNNELDKSLFQ